jgi:uncharacterized repeat protein (TIGR01451 family)
MARTTIIFAALFLVAGIVAALLPAQESAQESAWRKSSVENPSEPGRFQPAEPRPLSPNLRGAVYSAVPVAKEGGASAGLADDVGPIGAEESQSETAEANDEAAPADSGETRSVLKRPEVLPKTSSKPKPMTSEGEPSEAQSPTDARSAGPSIRSPGPRSLSPISAREAEPILTEQSPSLSPETQDARTKPSAAASTRRPTAKNRVAAAQDTKSGQVSLESHQPNIHVQVTGPAALTVGKPAKFVVRVLNEGGANVEDVQVFLPLPAWVTVQGAESTGGEAQSQADSAGMPRLVWNLPSVKAKSSDELHLQLTAAEGQPFDLNVEWTCRPAAAHARITVRQPQLELSLTGASDLLFGEEKIFTLLVRNPGSGDASGVLVNIATGGNKPKEVAVGNIPAGEQVEIPVQVVANQVGELKLTATASGEGGLKAETVTKILIRRAQLAVAVEAPELKFAGTEATFAVTVSNSGNAAAEDVKVSLAIPGGARYIGGISGATIAKGNLSWKIGSIAPNAQKQFEIRCQLLVEGTNRVAVQASGKSGLTASGEAATEVEAISELKLIVNDPSGPSPTGQEVAYEIQVMNRGSRSSKNVKILVQFADGVEPTELAGGQGKLVPGQVVCEPLPELAAGEQVTLRVKAKASKTGTHRYRVEVTSGDDDARLVSEGTSRFFDSRGGAAARTAKKPAKEAPATKQR